MLHFLLGRAGSGKTTAVRARLKALAESGEGALCLLVPEQASFENERALLRLLGPRGAARVEVLSFSRLCDALSRRYGGGAGRRLDDGGRAILMSLALDAVRDQLQFYRRSAQGTQLVSLLLQADAEFCSCAISPQQLREAAAGAAEPSLKQKVEELSLILSAYRALVHQSWLDPREDLDRAAQTLETHPFFADTTVFVDGYQSFTRQQYAVLRAALRQAKDVTVALCADSLDDPAHGMGIFSIVKQTAAALLRCAREEGVEVASPEVLSPGARFLSDDLRAVEAGVFRGAHAAAQEKAEHAAIYAARDAYDEAAFAAASIRRLLAAEVCRARDIVVMARDLDGYRRPLAAAFSQYEIPYFMDEARDITHEPLMRYVLSAFAAVRTHWDTEAVLACVKTGLAGIDGEGVAQLENYCFVWSITGRRWCEPFTMHPDGFSQPWTDEDRARLESLEAARQTVMGPLLSFAKASAHATGKELSKAVYALLEKASIPAHLETLAAALEAGGRPALADDAVRLWDLLMQVLDQCALVLGDAPVERGRFEELLTLVLQRNPLAGIPQGIDEVTVGAADRIRTESPKIVFVLGAARGDFPKTPGGAGVLRFSERLALIEGGLPLNDTLAGVDVQERFLAYSAVSAGRERLFLSWPAAAADGTPKQPSPLIEEVRRALREVPVYTEKTLPTGFFACSRDAAFSALARRFGAKDAQQSALRALFSGPEDRPRLEALDRAAKQAPARLRDIERAKALFGGRMRISASQAQTFAQCPFAYFCQYGLRARPRRKAELDPLTYGSLMHYLLERLFRDTGAEKLAALSRPELEALIRTLLQEYVEAQLPDAGSQGARFTFLLARTVPAAAAVTAHIAEELCQSAFEPVDFELPVGGEDGIPALVLELADGGSAEIIGKIDRVDAYKAGGRTWLRVVDYKTGHKTFRMADLLDGMNLQMLLYLAALYENGGGRYENPAPAGVLYMPASEPSVPVDADTTREKRLQKQAEKLRMVGIVRADPGLLSAMEPSGEGRYIPVKFKQGIPARSGSAVTEKELEALLSYVKDKVRSMAGALREGRVEAVPLQGTALDVCAHCEFAAVCGHEPDGAARKADTRRPDAALKAIVESEGGKPV